MQREKKRVHEQEIGAIIKSVALEALSCEQSMSKRNVKRIRRSPVEITRRNDSQMLTRDARKAKVFSVCRRLYVLKTVRLNVHFAAISECTRYAILD